MYEHAEPEVDRILRLAERVPEDLRAKAFEILLQGYVSSLLGPAVAQRSAAGTPARQPPPAPPPADAWDLAIPTEVKARIQAMAKRRNAEAQQLAALFDFSADPFTFVPLHVPGKGNADRTRKVALLVAARSFLATGKWAADWAEIKAMATHQNCYDLPNFSKVLTGAQGSLFKSAKVGTGVELSAQGTDQAESLLTKLAAGDAA
jgi:hypothetical protein